MSDLEEARAILDFVCRKLGVTIDGCGCCSSPWLEHADGDGQIEHLKLGFPLGPPQPPPPNPKITPRKPQETATSADFHRWLQTLSEEALDE